MTDKKPEDSTDILAWKNSLKLMSNEAINKFLLASMEKGLIQNEKELSMTFLRDKIAVNICLMTHFYCQMVMGKNN